MAAEKKKPLTDGEKTIKFIETHLWVPEGTLIGQPIELLDFQKKFLLDVLDNPNGTSLAILSMSRKAGKSSLLACLALSYLIGPLASLNLELLIGARAAMQSAIILKLCVKMLELNPALQGLVHNKPSTNELYGIELNTHMKALAADTSGSRSLGSSPKILLLDESGAIRGETDPFFDSLTSGQGAHDDALCIHISTQAATDNDYFSLLIDEALNGDDAHTVCHLHTAKPECEIMDEEQWYNACPSLGLFTSYKNFKQQAKAAERTPSKAASFRNLQLNQRISINNAFFSTDLWKENAAKPARIDPDIECYGGLDLSVRTDLTALVLIQKIEKTWNIHPFVFTPEEGLLDRSKKDRTPYHTWAEQGVIYTTPGHTVDYEWVIAFIAENLSHLNIKHLSFDRWNIKAFQKEMERAELDIPMVECGQGFRSMAPALDSLEAEALNKRLAHGNHPALTASVLNAVVKTDPTGARKLDKSRGTGRIDALQALAMCFSNLSEDKEEKKKTDITKWISDPIIL